MSRVERFLQPVDGIAIVGKGPLSEKDIQAGRARVAAGESADAVAADLAAEAVAREQGAPAAPRSLAGRETAVHAAADKNLGPIRRAMRETFAAARHAYAIGGKDAAVKAMRDHVHDALPPVLLKALVAGGTAALGMLPQVRAAGDVPGHEFHGNQYTEKGIGDSERQHGEVVAKSKYGQIEVVKHGIETHYLGRRKSGESVGTFKKINSAKDALRSPKNTESFPSGYRSPDVQWKHLATKITTKFDASRPDAAQWAREHAAELAKGLSETTEQAIRDAIANEAETGEDAYDDILAAIGDETRAELIARTESMTAANEGQRQGWDQAVEDGLLPDDATKVWIAAADPCPECDELDGEEVALGEDYPGDGGDGPPLHPNCRCTEGIVSA